MNVAAKYFQSHKLKKSDQKKVVVIYTTITEDQKRLFGE